MAAATRPSPSTVVWTGISALAVPASPALDAEAPAVVDADARPVAAAAVAEGGTDGQPVLEAPPVVAPVEPPAADVPRLFD